MNRLTIVGIIAAMVLFSAPCIWAKDWHKLHDLSDEQLTEKVSEFKRRLDQDPSDYETIKGLGIICHIKATKDSKKYAPKAVEFLAKALEANKKDYETMCYLGSATTMMAKTTWNPLKKMSYVNKGTALMDKAVRRDPDNVSVRMTRANNSKRLPSFLKRGDFAVEDFEHLAALIEKRPEISVSIKKEIYANLAELYGKADDKTRSEKFKNLAKNLSAGEEKNVPN